MAIDKAKIKDDLSKAGAKVKDLAKAAAKGAKEIHKKIKQVQADAPTNKLKKEIAKLERMNNKKDILGEALAIAQQKLETKREIEKLKQQLKEAKRGRSGK